MNEVMGWPGPTTQTQFVAWREWFKLEWNRPSRTDHYLMAVRMSVAAQKAKTRVTMSQMKLPFVFPDPYRDPTKPKPGWEPGMPRPVTKDDMVRAAKTRDLKIAGRGRGRRGPPAVPGRKKPPPPRST